MTHKDIILGINMVCFTMVSTIHHNSQNLKILTRYLASLILFFIVIILGIQLVSANTNWENESNITGLFRVNDIDSNSNKDTLSILCGAHIEEWSLVGSKQQSSIWPGFTSLGDMDWNDEGDMLAIEVNTINRQDLQELNSPIAIINANGGIIEAYKPFGNLSPYRLSIIMDLEWRPNSSQLAILFQDGMLIVYDIENQSVSILTKYSWSGKEIKFNPSGTHAIILTEDYRGWNELHYLDIRINESLTVYKSSLTIHDIEWSYDGNLILILLSDGLYSIPITTLKLTFFYLTPANYLSASPVEPIILLIEKVRGMSFWNYQLNSSEFHPIELGLTEQCGWTQDGSYFYSEEEGTMVVRIWTKTSRFQNPTVGITYPVSGNNVSGNVIISGWALSVYPEISFIVVKIGNDEWMPADGFLQWHYQVDLSKFPLGGLNIRAKAIDPIGESNISIIRVYITNTQQHVNQPPLVWIDKPTNDEIVKGDLVISGGAIDDVSIQTIQVKIGTQSWRNVPIELDQNEIMWTYIVSLSSVNTSILLSARAFDGKLYSEIISVRVIVNQSTISPFIIRILYPTQDSVLDQDFRTIGIVEGGEPEVVYVSIDDGPLYIADGIWTWSYVFTNVSTGNHWIKAVALNGSLISQMDSVSFSIENLKVNQAPEIGILQPQKGTVIQGDFVIQGWSTDDTQVEQIEIRINNRNWFLVNGTNIWNQYIDDNNLNQGWNSITARAFDGELYSQYNNTTIYYLPSESTTSYSNRFLIFIVISLIIIIFILTAFLIKKRGKLP